MNFSHLLAYEDEYALTIKWPLLPGIEITIYYVNTRLYTLALSLIVGLGCLFTMTSFWISHKAFVMIYYV